jgi:hypothetical protein
MLKPKRRSKESHALGAGDAPAAQDACAAIVGKG